MKPTRGEKLLNVTPGSAPGKLSPGSQSVSSGLAAIEAASAWSWMRSYRMPSCAVRRLCVNVSCAYAE